MTKLAFFDGEQDSCDAVSCTSVMCVKVDFNVDACVLVLFDADGGRSGCGSGRRRRLYSASTCLCMRWVEIFDQYKLVRQTVKT